MKYKILLAFVSLSLSILHTQILVAKTKEYYLTIENHVFSPTKLVIQANEKVMLKITNKDPVAEEFDSFDLNREKVIFAGKQATIYIGPLEPGIYEYFGEFHPNSARGEIIVEESKNAD